MTGEEGTADSVLDNIIAEKQTLQTKNQQLSTALASSTYQSTEGANLAEFQLDPGEMLSKIEHFLKGDYIGFDDQGNEAWIMQTNPDLILFNEYGVNSIMAILGNYIDKNTFLSTYDEMRINEILADLGEEIAKFIFCNYEKMGMDTEFKKTRYPLAVITIIHAVESAYRRAIHGQTSKAINENKIVTQSELLGRTMPMQPQGKKSFNPFRPSTW